MISHLDTEIGTALATATNLKRVAEFALSIGQAKEDTINQYQVFHRLRSRLSSSYRTHKEYKETVSSKGLEDQDPKTRNNYTLLEKVLSEWDEELKKLERYTQSGGQEEEILATELELLVVLLYKTRNQPLRTLGWNDPRTH
ncbi:hypothetical protein A1O3_01449 [Capronia epimyces CBS 606.96]|uniref:Uncharacterized protein n=1 Tax=Capronia epimyces CBS 606.96 TaxID=1182542 RepID=W9YTB7_9EURO|nr:uncharacterized protein A1O3_01449 [Capronia epimyces CBS 606.96]EXJ92895.1 hypothetical protein A1O3_01449 [Capronia epimyces CBS 606.96]